MANRKEETPALLIIDMVKDNLDEKNDFPITPFASQIIAPINSLIGVFREQEWPIVFSTDAYRREDFIFEGRLKPFSLVGTEGAEVADELDYREGEDLWLPKPRFSAFFKTGLDQWLRERGVTLCAVAGIATEYCVLTTVMDAICHDFKAVFLEDCSASYSESIHEQTLGLYRRNPLYPLMRVISSSDLVAELVGDTSDV
ncbi:MAG: isochorismatase family cysteine hydrolase [Anaerolineae bacterium]